MSDTNKNVNFIDGGLTKPDEIKMKKLGEVICEAGNIELISLLSFTATTAMLQGVFIIDCFYASSGCRTDAKWINKALYRLPSTNT